MDLEVLLKLLEYIGSPLVPLLIVLLILRYRKVLKKLYGGAKEWPNKWRTKREIRLTLNKNLEK